MNPVDQAEGASGYEQFFGFKEPPFSLAPDPRFLFASASHSAALAQLAYAIDRREPIVVVTGEIGTGKTLLCRTVLRRLPRKTFVSVVDDPLLGPDDLLKQLLHDFGVISRDRARVTEASRHELVQALHAFLRSLAAIHAHAVVIIDEAQHLQPAVLEQIRLLSNVEDERGTLLQIILVGQRDIEPLLSRPELRQIQQRVVRHFQLGPLTGEEVQKYVAHRLELARHGIPASDVPGAIDLARALAEWEREGPSVDFDPGAIEAISQLTKGLPRLINLICDRALEAAFETRSRAIDASVIQATARALGVGETRPPDTPAVIPDAAADRAPAGRRSWRLFAAATLLTALAGAAIWIGVHSAGPRTTAVPNVTAPAPAVVVPKPNDAAIPETAPAAPPAAAMTPSDATVASDAAAPADTRHTAIGGYEIVVASFRTEPRAASVEAQVATLGVPVRRRVQGTWQQVICGPFASRDDAEDAQQRLARAGFTGTQVVSAPR